MEIVRAHDAIAKAPSRQLEIEGMKVVAGKADEKGHLKIDAGAVKMEFPFKNPGPKVVKILKVEPAFTTGVTTAFKDGKMEYAPGESGVLQVTYDPAKDTIPWYYKEVRLVCEGDVSQFHPRVHFVIPQKAAESGKKTNKVDSHTESVLAAVARAKASPSRQLEIEGMKVVAGKADEKGMLKIDAGPVKMEFPFKNLGPKVVKILEVEPAFTTGVTTAFKDGKMEYAPGESGVLQVTYDPAKETNPWYYKEVRLVCEGDVSQIHPRVHFGIPQ